MMTISKTTYKGIPALECETDSIRLKFLPENGCRLQSIVDKQSDKEFLALDPDHFFKPQFLGGSYVEGDVSGCDDMFPTIDPMTFDEGERKGIEYPCHGEVCRVAHKVEMSEDGFSTFYHSQSLNYDYKKTITEGENGGVKISYEITNTGNDDFRCMWAAHFMAAAEKGGYAVTPFEDGDKGEIMFDEDGQYGKRNDVFAVPKAALCSGEYSKSANAYKFFYLDKLSEGKVGYFVPSVGKAVTLRFDKEKLPYIGVWVNNGRFKEMYNIAMEIATSPFDKPETAIERGIDFKIPAGQSFKFDITVTVE